MENHNDLFRRLEQLNEIGTALSSERQIDRLLEMILDAAKTITRADAGTLYRVDDAQGSLQFAIVRNDRLHIAFGGASGQPVPGQFPDLPFQREDGSPNDNLVAVHAALAKCTVNIADAYNEQGFDFSGTRKFDAGTGYRSQSFLTVPMKNHEGEVIGVLQLINALDAETGQVVPFSRADQHLVESLASQAAVALTNRLLIDQLEVLFESFIRMINLAIDEKSPYTGGHCQRVPVLTMMLAEAVNDTRHGELADFTLNEADRYQLRIASLIHDCGKVTTPVHVVDKATKLETIFDRIELLDTRFELVKRDAEIRKWKAIAEGADPLAADAEYLDFCAACDVDRAFLQRSNIGSERMRDEDIARIEQIDQRYHWTDAAGERRTFMSDDERENLSIRAGTLTAAEREVINYHIVATIKMLEQLPWPKHLCKVTEYAGGHHERMDGKGYPNALTRDQMSWQARMIAIADIFEALTANDRPYKQSMKLSQALSILNNFSTGGHIDPELHRIFVDQQVYRKYAERFLKPEQIDC